MSRIMLAGPFDEMTKDEKKAIVFADWIARSYYRTTYHEIIIGVDSDLLLEDFKIKATKTENERVKQLKEYNPFLTTVLLEDYESQSDIIEIVKPDVFIASVENYNSLDAIYNLDKNEKEWFEERNIKLVYINESF